MMYLFKILRTKILFFLIEFITIFSLSFTISAFLSLTPNRDYLNYQKTFEHFDEEAIKDELTFLPEVIYSFDPDINYYDDIFGTNHWFLKVYEYSDINFLIDPHNNLKDGYFKVSKNLPLFDKPETAFYVGPSKINVLKDDEYLNIDNTILINLSTVRNGLVLTDDFGNAIFYKANLLVIADDTNSYQIWKHYTETDLTYYLEYFGVDIWSNLNSYAGAYSALVFIIPLFVLSTLFIAHLNSSFDKRNCILLLRYGRSKSSALKKPLIYQLILTVSSFILSFVLLIILSNYLYTNSIDAIDLEKAILLNFLLNAFVFLLIYLYSYFYLSESKLVENIRNDD